MKTRAILIQAVRVLLILLSLFLNPLLQLHAETIDKKEAVMIGGIQQWLWMKGSTEKPIVLFLHGGPGNSMMSYAHTFTKRLEPHFLIVHWDQRESGETLTLNRTDQPLSLDLNTSDAVEVVRYLTNRFHQSKIFVIGHSWGAFLVLLVAHQVPDLVRSCIAMSPMTDQIKSEQLALDWMNEQAAQEKNQEAIQELSTVRIPFAETSDIYTHRKWLSVFGKRKPVAFSFVETWSKTWLPLFNEGSSVNLFTAIPRYECPVYFLVGRHDYQTNSGLTEKYEQSIQAPDHRLIWFEQSAHSPHLTETKKFQEVILSLLQQR